MPRLVARLLQSVNIVAVGATPIMHLPQFFKSSIVPQITGSNLLASFFALASVLFLFSGHLRIEKITKPRLLPLEPEAERNSGFLASQTGFAKDAVYTIVPAPRVGRELQRVGSWLGTDATTCRAETVWYRPVNEFSFLVAGYPNSHGCQLFVEVRRIDGSSERIPFFGDNPTEAWKVRTVSLTRSKTIAKFRIVAIDGSTGVGGWLGFSQPFHFSQNLAEFTKQFAQLLLVVLTAAAAFVAILFPGLLLRRISIRPGGHRLAFVWVPVTGFLYLAFVALVCWFGPSAISPRRISQIALGPLFFYALYHSLRFPLDTFTSKMERRVLLVTVLLASVGISKATYSLGPLGELSGGLISRTLEVGGRSDSQIPYHVFQLVATRSSAHGSLAAYLFMTWGFSSRPPLVGLAASPVVLTLPVHVPQGGPDQIRTIFDPEGFSAFRTALIVIACCSLTAVFELATLFMEEEWAFFAFLVTVTTPFVIHETYFVWPKLEAAWFALLATYFILQRRCLLAGLLWGIGYLCHPLVLLSAPALLAVVCLDHARKRPDGLPPVWLSRWIWQPISLFVGLGFCGAIWAFINRGHFSQSFFLTYVAMADGRVPTLANWIRSRWDSVANTLIPLNLFLLHSENAGINSVYSPSPSIVRFYFQYWTTLPFGMGIAFFPFLIKTIYQSLFLEPAWLLLVFVVPFAGFSIYWGVSTSGMLCEGLHPWILGLLIFFVVMFKRSLREGATRKKELTYLSVALMIRGVETVLMLLLTAIWSNHKFVNEEFVLGDSLSLITLLISVGWLHVLMFRYALRLPA